jgi:hypothetical protein
MFSIIRGLYITSQKIFLASQWDCWIRWFEFFFLVILSELTVKRVIEFDGFLRILEHQWKC